MRGFQPAATRAAAQNYADGGMVRGLKRLFGMGDSPQGGAAPNPPAKVLVQSSTPAPVTPPAPEPNTESQKAISQYAGNSALERRMREAGAYANGGMVRGPGTGTSDDVQDEVPAGTYIMPADSTKAIGADELGALGGKVPVNLSNGEFKLPPEQVHAVGVQALDHMKNATHKPAAARGFSAGAQRPTPEPRVFFADGGNVGKRLFLEDGGNTSQSRLEEEGQTPVQPATPAPQPSPSSATPSPSPSPTPTNTFPGNRLAGESGFSGAPSTNSSAPAATSAPAAPPTASGFMPGTRSVYNESGKAIGDLLNQGRVGAAAGETARAAMAYVPAVADDVIGGAIRAVGPSVLDAGKQLLGLNDGSASTTTATATPTKTPAETQQSVSTPPAAAKPQDAATSISSPTANSAPATNAPDLSGGEPAKAANQIAPGVFQHGRGQYSDRPSDMGFAPGFTGQPSANANAAAGSLADRSQLESQARVNAGQPPERGWSGVIGTAPGSSASRERADLVSALMTPHPGTRGLTTSQRNGMLSLLGQDSQAQQASDRNATSLQQTQMQNNMQRDLSASREAGDMSRAVIREQGDTNRANARNAIDQGRLALDQQVRGFDIRNGQRQEKLYERYDAAKTPEDRSVVEQQIRALSGRSPESPWKLQVTPATKNLDGSTSEGSIVRYNGQTGQAEKLDLNRGSTSVKQPMPKIGEVTNGLRYRGGNPNDKNNWERV